MPLIKSAIKRVRVASQKRKVNLITLRRYRELVKELVLLIDSGKKAEAIKLFPSVQKAIDLAAKKNIIHRNTASRQKSNLVKRIEKIEAKAA